MSRSRASDIPELILRLGSRSPATVDAARARLSIIGSRAVEDLIDVLDGEDNRMRARVMPILALIRDARGRAPLTAMLLDRSWKMREVAARSLGRFPARETVCALRRLLDHETVVRVRSAAVHALVEQYVAGRDEAVSPVLERLTHTNEHSVVRLAAFDLLPQLKPAERRRLVARFAEDPDAAVRARARDTACETSRHEEVTTCVAHLRSDDYARWNEAVRCLASSGVAAVAPLVDEMRRRQHDPEFCTRAGMALKAMGRRQGRAIAEAMDRTPEPLPLRVLVEVVGALGQTSLIYRLQQVIERIGNAEATQNVRARAHLELARIGSRVAIQDLRDFLADPSRPVEPEVLEAVKRIGTREELGGLLLAYGREGTFARDQIAAVVREIMRRERIRRNSRALAGLGVQQRRALEAILPPVRRRSRPRVPRPAAAES